MRNPEAPAIASAGIRIRNPQGMDCLTWMIVSVEPNSSAVTVESQKARIVTNPIAPATG